MAEMGGMVDWSVEVDDTYIGSRRNMSSAKRKDFQGTGRGAVSKTAVVGARARKTRNVAAEARQD